MQSLRLLIATAVLAVAAAQPDRSAWDPTARDRTEECKEFTIYAPDEKKCDVFNACCKYDPLNGDKCKNQIKTCESDDNGDFTMTCTYTNCTEMITTTTTTTQSPRQVNGGAVYSLFLSASALLPLLL